MGTCLSKKSATAPSPSPLPPTIAQSAINSNPSKQETKPPDLQKKKPEEEGRAVKKEIFVIRHRKSHETERQSVDGNGDSKKDPDEVSEPVKGPAIKNGLGHLSVVSAPVRTSSCTKEEVDAILIQCGKLSRSPSRSVGSSDNNNNGSLQKTKKYSGSKRSFDFDKEHEGPEENVEADGELERLHRQRQRQQRQPRHSLSPSTSSRNRRRTPSRERDPQEQRSGSRERNGGGAAGGGRRVSRSPGKRSESPNTVTSGNCRPGKMVSVPATVAMDKSIDGENILAASAVKRIQVRRNVGGGGGDGSRATAVASPRARSPATNQQQQQPSLSRSNSRKAEHSPFRRNPLGEIDTNVIIEPSGGTNNKPAKHNSSSQVQKINGDNISNMKVGLQGSNTNKLCSNNKTKEEEHHVIVEEHKVVGGNNAKVNLITPAGAEESLKTVTTRSRSSRLSRDLDINPEALLSNSSSSTQNYTALLLEDIQNFHQKNTPNAPSAFSLPACVTKACSILDAVADLNSSTSEDRRRNFKSDQFVNTKNIIGVKDQESSSIEPSIHKYVTLRRGNIVEDEEGDGEDQESSGSNSFAGASSGQQKPYWLSSSSSSWEPNSGDSTSRSYSRGDENHRSPLAGVQRHDTTIMDESGTRRLAAKKKRDMEQSGVGNVRVGGGPHMSSVV